MAFTATTDRRGETTLISLDGELDSVGAPAFHRVVEQAIADPALRELVLDLSNLTYLSSAGLRGLVFARQKMSEDVTLVLAGASGPVEQTIRLVGFHHSVSLRDTVPAPLT